MTPTLNYYCVNCEAQLTLLTIGKMLHPENGCAMIGKEGAFFSMNDLEDAVDAARAAMVTS